MRESYHDFYAVFSKAFDIVTLSFLGSKLGYYGTGLVGCEIGESMPGSSGSVINGLYLIWRAAIWTSLRVCTVSYPVSFVVEV